MGYMEVGEYEYGESRRRRIGAGTFLVHAEVQEVTVDLVDLDYLVFGFVSFYI